MKQLIKVAAIALLACTVLFLLYRSRQNEKEVIIKVKVAKSASYTEKEARNIYGSLVC
ncbi:MAG: hypothetical protein J5I59_06090 [Saprospiraceae bacterium]|nr:hypothetical protein [Saprospiraceae bacterium]